MRTVGSSRIMGRDRQRIPVLYFSPRDPSRGDNAPADEPLIPKCASRGKVGRPPSARGGQRARGKHPLIILNARDQKKGHHAKRGGPDEVTRYA